MSDEAVVAVSEERTRIGNDKLTEKTSLVATEEGYGKQTMQSTLNILYVSAHVWAEQRSLLIHC